MKQKYVKYNNRLCDKTMTFEDCELAILRHAVDTNEKIQKQKKIKTEGVDKMINILEGFLVKKKLVCYGGTAINNILPANDQFYDRDIEIPDYDFYSPNALKDAKELADLYYSNGYKEVEAKSGVHHGTYKVFVDFIPIADITFLDPYIYKSIHKEAIKVAGIYYAPPNFLRMGVYLELSRPEGDVTRWEKVFKRLLLLNKHYPLKTNKCDAIDFQRKFEGDEKLSVKIYNIVKDTFINLGVIFFGGYASSIYANQLPKRMQKEYSPNPDFDVLCEDIDKCALIVKERLEDADIKRVNIIHHPPIGEIIPKHIELRIGKDTIAFIFEPIACHSYNTIKIAEQSVKIATIDTMMSFYLAFIYADVFSFFKERILCMAEMLFNIEKQNRLKQYGILKRFSSTCIGTQETLEDIRIKKANKFKELKKNTEEYESWFLKYIPSEEKHRVNKTDNQNDTQPNNQKIQKKIREKTQRKTKSKTRKTRKTQLAKNIIDAFI
jgi:hypothetical protein